MSVSIVNDNVVFARRVPFEGALTSLNDAPKRPDRHDTLDVGPTVDDTSNAAIDLDDGRLVDECRKPCVFHTQLLHIPSRAAQPSITCISVNAVTALRGAEPTRAEPTGLISTVRNALPRARRAGALPRVSPSFPRAVTPIAAPIIHSAREVHQFHHEDAHG